MNLTNHRRISGKLEISSYPLHGAQLRQQPPKRLGSASSPTLNLKMTSEKHSTLRYDFRTMRRTSVDRRIQVAPIAAVSPSTEVDTKVTTTTIMPASGLPRPTCWPKRPSRFQPVLCTHTNSRKICGRGPMVNSTDGFNRTVSR